MWKSCLIGALCAAVFTLISTTSQATLISRLGGAAAYDDVLDITWTTNADTNGSESWANQVAWAAGFSLGGFDDWRLASMSVAAGLPIGTSDSVVDCSTATELACRDNELGYMFYQNMGGSFGDNKTGTQTVDGVDLTNIGVEPIYQQKVNVCFTPVFQTFDSECCTSSSSREPPIAVHKFKVCLLEATHRNADFPALFLAVH